MSLLVLAYPKISKKDFDFIQSYRKENDLRYFSLVKPHFTIVFSTNKLDEKDFIDEIELLSSDISQFAFELKVATINFDDSKTYYHEFLVPDKGFSNFVLLHDKLYSKSLFDQIRFDIDFIPHIGIGNSDDVKTSKSRIDALNNNGVSINGMIDTLDIVKYENNTITTLQQIVFKK